jgi:predicted amidohydrolase
LAETIPGQSTKLFSRLAKKHNIVIVAPLFEKSKKGKFYNTAVVIGCDGEITGTYRKAHIPYDPYFYEKNYFEPGDSDYQVFDTSFARIGVLICYDQWFPEPARINMLKGAEIIFYPRQSATLKPLRRPAIGGACYRRAPRRNGPRAAVNEWRENGWSFGEALLSAMISGKVLCH